MSSGDQKTIAKDEAWELAVRRESVIRGLLEKGDLTADDTNEACQALEISLTLLYRLIKRYKNDRRTSSLLPQKRGRPKGISVLAPEVEKLIDQGIANHYLTSQKPSVAKLERVIASEARKVGLPCPSRTAISSRINLLDQRVVIAKREGAKTANMTVAPMPGKYNISRPLEVVEVDHTRVDVFVVDEKDRLPIQRPWLTILIDVATRMVTGYYLSLEPPSSTSVALALQNSVLTKEKWLEERGVDIPWPVSGIPETLHMDNAKEFHAKALRRGAQEYGIKLFYRPKGRPHFGGHIERLIGTMMGECHILPGTTFSDIAARGEYDSEGKATMTLKELDHWLAHQIIGRYHNKVHKSLGRPPIAVWNELATGLDVPLRRPDSEQMFFYEFLPYELRKIRRDGIELFGIRYWDNVLTLWAGITDGKFTVRYDPRDMSVVFVQSPEGEYWPVRYANIGHPAVTLWEYRHIRKKLLEQGRSETNEKAIFESVETQREIVESATSKSKSARRQHQRVMDAITAKKSSPAKAQTSQRRQAAASGYEEEHGFVPYEVEEWD